MTLDTTRRSTDEPEDLDAFANDGSMPQGAGPTADGDEWSESEPAAERGVPMFSRLVGDVWDRSEEPSDSTGKRARRASATVGRRDPTVPLTQLLWSRLQGPSPARRQGLAAALFMFAVIVALLTPSTVVDISGVLAGCAILFLNGGVACLITFVPQWTRWQNVVAGLDFITVEVLRTATGGSTSIFGALAIVPVIWAARCPGRENVLYASLGIAWVFLLPPLLSLTHESDPTWLISGIFYIAVYTTAAAIVHELARNARRQFKSVRARERAIVQEIDRGAEVQQALLPKGASPLTGYDVAGRCIPAKSVGGDFYDWYPIPGGLGLTLGDVMGKGVGAGMIAATAHAVVRSARLDENPVAALLRTDACLSDELVDVGSFTTMFHGRLRAEDGRLRYADAGHGLTLHVHADGSWERLSATDLPLGLGVGAEWECRELVLEPDDMLVSFSDGVLELWDGSLAAAEHVGALAASSSSAAELVDAVTRMAIQTSNPDDVTVLAVRRERSA